ncbi:zinc metalloproteinase nas-14-like [Diaphorina citri]|uniref:Metalloendopeptidase n=1 Tax=Diaphorina citri TaxID=121845 RepID=A0A3Q0J854_DIACI|nr:zinc metalloproteinase nas-14-like [Diaphorina citri]
MTSLLSFSGTERNFKKYPPSEITDFGVGYDFDSVMHYSRKAFSKNGDDTIVPHDPTVEIGQRVGLSEKDILKANRMYKCDKDGGGGYEKEEKKPYKE